MVKCAAELRRIVDDLPVLLLIIRNTIMVSLSGIQNWQAPFLTLTQLKTLVEIVARLVDEKDAH